MEEKTKVLEVKDLSVSYTVANVKTHILEDVSFAVSKGKSVGDRRRVRLRKDDDDARHPECSSFQWECRKGRDIILRRRRA
ncbi:MAG: hypothetical protein ACLTLQ_18905 [[Clostridium] scindens]